MSFINKFNETAIEDMNISYFNALKSDNEILSNEQLKFLKSKIKSLNKNNIIKAIKYWSAWNSAEAILFARENSVFKYNRYSEENIALEIINQLLLDDSIIKNQKNVNYLMMKKNMQNYYNLYKYLDSKMVSNIKKHHSNRIRYNANGKIYESNLIRELLAYSEINYNKQEENNIPIGDLNKIQSITREQVCYYISYLAFIYNREIGINNDVIPITDMLYILSKDIQRLILLASKYIKLNEYELMVDYYDYTFKRNKYNYWITCDNSNLQLVSDYGYYRNFRCNSNRLDDLDKKYDNNYLSIYSIIDKFIEDNEIPLKTLSVGSVYKTYEVDIPESLLVALQWVGSYYKEEAVLLEYTYSTTMLSEEYLQTIEIIPNVTLDKMYIFFRLVIIYDVLFHKLIYYNKDIPERFFSLPPLLSKNKIIKSLKILANGDIEAEAILDFFTAKFNGGILNLHYSPIIEFGENLLFPINILSHSNFPRNIVSQSYSINNQTVNIHKSIKLESICDLTFKKAGYQTLSSKSYSRNGISGDIDIIAYNDTDLILIECKSPVTPGSVYEMRSYYDCSIKASKQLDNAKSVFSDISYLNSKLSEWNINIHNPNIITCVIIGDRIMSGFKYSEHPIISSYELIVLLVEGKMSASDISNIDKKPILFNMWREEHYSHEDLLDFLYTDKNYIKIGHETSDEYFDHFVVDGINIKYKKFIPNIKNLLKRFNEEFTLTKQ